MDAEAMQFLAEVEQTVQAGDHVHARRLVACVHAARDLLAGCPDVARRRLAPLLAPGIVEHDVASVQTLLAQALLDLGEVAEAAEVASRAVARARTQGMRVLLVDALRAAALVAARQGHREEAAGLLQEGLALARRLGYPYAEALLLQTSGEMDVQTGQPERARAGRDEALAILRRLGARRDDKPVAGLVACW
jgi:hypothetical protein